MEIRGIRREESETCLRLRRLLWPNVDSEDLARELEELLDNGTRNSVLVATAHDGRIIGFVDVSLRDWAEGCATCPVGYIEGWYVLPEYRKQGIGRRLVEAAETWAWSRGCTEMGSDMLLGNTLSELVHRALGYNEVERLVLFSKRLTQ